MAEGAVATANPACLGLALPGAAEAAVALLGAGSRALCQTLSWLLEVLGCSLREQRATPPPAFVWCGLERDLPLSRKPSERHPVP